MRRCCTASSSSFLRGISRSSFRLRPAFSRPPRPPPPFWPFVAPVHLRWLGTSDADAVGDSTIYALSTAAGRAAIAVVRISGPACLSIYAQLCPAKPSPPPRTATLRSLHQPGSGGAHLDILDAAALVLYFPAPESATGEDVLELHVHGGPAIVRAVLAAIPRCSSPSLSSPLHASTGTPWRGGRIRPAEPGEFTRRAFQRRRLTLPEIEALGETLAASTEQQRRRAVQHTLHGARTSALYETWRSTLLTARGELEALIDFSEDGAFSTNDAALLAGVVVRVRRLAAILRGHLGNAVRGELLRSGISVSLVGAPNAGKSSLLNRVVGRDAVIVSEQPGTTRDVVDLAVDVGGYMVLLGDTAGLRLVDVGAVEREGIRRARERVLAADMVVGVLDVVTTSAAGGGGNGGSAGEGWRLRAPREVLEVLRDAQSAGKEVVVVVNKTDLLPSPPPLTAILDEAAQLLPNLPVFPLTCTSPPPPPPPSSSVGEEDDGVQAFLHGLTRLFKVMTSPIFPPSTSSSSSSSSGGDWADGDWAESIGATERQRVLVQECLEHLAVFLSLTSPSPSSSSSFSSNRDSNIDIDIEGNTEEEEKKKEIGNDVEVEVDGVVVVAAEELRAAADALGRVTGRGESGDVEEVLGVVFANFCVGK